MGGEGQEKGGMEKNQGKGGGEKEENREKGEGEGREKKKRGRGVKIYSAPPPKSFLLLSYAYKSVLTLRGFCVYLWAVGHKISYFPCMDLDEIWNTGTLRRFIDKIIFKF